MQTAVAPVMVKQPSLPTVREILKSNTAALSWE